MKNCQTILKSIVAFAILFNLISCEKQTDIEEPEVIERPLFRQPEHFPKATYNFSSPLVSVAGFWLGKRLFYDARLSRDGTVSCGSCHLQAAAFTHHGHDISHGIDDQLGNRNALPIQNMAFKKTFFWDGGVHNLDLLALAPIANPVEMDEVPENVLTKLRQDESYRKDFKKAYGTDEITMVQFLKALGQFQAALISDNSKYDKYVRGETNLETEELQGLEIFKQKCGSCHGGILFTDETYRNNGLEVYFRSTDLGRFNISSLEEDKYKYKVPSLRNVELTAPYMHDGRFRNLEAVLNHYDEGVNDTQNLDKSLKNSKRLGIPLSDAEKSKLITFLKTLTDNDFITDQRFFEAVNAK
jgi:cytochrome c peroxidase